MNAHDRRVIQSPLYHGEDEEIAYSLTTTPWGSSPTNVTVIVKDGDGNDVTATVTSGSASVAENVITLPTILNLTAGVEYQLEIQFTVGGNVMEAWCIIEAQE